MNLVGVTKPTRRQTHHIWKWSKANHVHTHSNVPIVKTTTKQTPICVCSGSTGSTANGIRRNISRSVKTRQSQFVLSGMVTHNDLWQLKNFFSECPQKFSDCQHYPRDPVVLQEPPWSIICTIPSSTSCKGKKLVGAPHYPNWLTFARSPTNESDFPRVLTYINIQVSHLHFSLQNDIFNHRCYKTNVWTDFRIRVRTDKI